MQPTVSQLEKMYQNEVTFEHIDAQSETGAPLFQELGLPGHPAYVIFVPDGREVFRTFGIVEQDILEDAIQNSLED